MTSSLRIPVLERGLSAADCALRYAACGWYVLPIGQRVKHAGSVLGRGWPTKTSRDPEIIRGWFDDHDDYGVALHVGRSGGLVFDVDQPGCVPRALQRHLADHEGPFQTTRLSDASGRGHYCFMQPAGASLGNGRGSLVGDWGDVRGTNGIIVVEPTLHAKQAEGGAYRWRRHGLLPPLPSDLQTALSPLAAVRAQRALAGAARPARPTTPAAATQRRGRVTLAELTQRVLEADQRNNTLFEAACRAGEMVAHGRLPRSRARAALLAAGRAAGLDDVELLGATGLAGTIESGLGTGMGSARRKRRG